MKLDRPRSKSKYLWLSGVLFLIAAFTSACTGTSGPEGWAGPVVSGGLILASPDHRHLAAYQIDSLQQQWTYPDDRNPQDKDVELRGIYGTPVVADSTVYFGDYNGSVYALSLSDGRPIWTARTDGPIIGSPLVLGNAVYIGSSDGHLYAFDRSNGQPIWPAFRTTGSIWSTPAEASGTIYVASMDGQVYAIDAASGQPVWEKPFKASAGFPSSPTVASGLVIIGGMDRRLHALDAATGEERWSFEAGNWFWTQPLVVNNTVYAGSLDGRVYAIDIETGAARWSQPFKAVAAVRSTPVLAEDVLVIADREGNIYGLDPATGQEVEWSRARDVRTRNDVLADLESSNGNVYVVDRGGFVYRLEARSGAVQPLLTRSEG